MLLIETAAHGQSFVPGNDRVPRSRENHTLVGSVTVEPVAQQFVVVANNNFTYRIRAQWALPPTLSAGDRVRAYGDWKDGMLYAGNVRILTEGDASDNVTRNETPPRTIQGVVVQNEEGNEFIVRARNEWTYPVLAPQGKPDSLTIGDRVRVYGLWRHGALHAKNIRILYEGAVLKDVPDPEDAPAAKSRQE